MLPGKKIRVLVTDDSALMKLILRDIVNSQPDMEVVGVASNGLEAIEKCKELNPDVITLDIEMPKMSGIEALKRIIEEKPTPVIMVSSLTEEGAAITTEALEIGAVDFVTKPSGSISGNFRTVADELVEKIRNAAQVDVNKLRYRPKLAPSRKSLKLPSLGLMKKAVGIASSTGGPRSLQYIIPALPANFPAPVFLVQHMPPTFTKSLAMRLDRDSQVTVVEAGDGDMVKSGVVYVAPGDYHMGIRAEGNEMKVYLDKAEKINNVRPAADYTFDKMAEIFGANSIGVVLTGMGKDGTLGVFKIKHYGGRVIAESKETCIVYGMPKSVVEEGYADYVLPVYEIADKLVELVEG